MADDVTPPAADAGRLRPWELAAVAALALAVRVVYVLATKLGDTDLTDEGDAIYYSQQALLNARGQWFEHAAGTPAADHPPLTALLLTPVAWLTDGSILAERFVMVTAGTVAVAVIAVLAAHLAGRPAGLAAGVIGALYAGLWINDGLLYAEAPTALLVALVLLVSIRLWERPSAGRAAALGGICGLAALTRGELALLVVLLAVPAALLAGGAGGPRPRRLGRAALVVGAAAIVVAPWVVWNLARFEHPVLLATNDGFTLAGSNCDTTYDTTAIGFWSLDCSLAAVPPEGDHSVMDRRLRQVGLEYMGDNLERLPTVVLARLGRTWGLYAPGQMVSMTRGEGREPLVSWIATYSYWALAPVAVAGAVVARRRGLRLWPFGATVVMVTAVTVAVYGTYRFRVPADVGIVVLAGIAVAAATGRLAPAVDR